MVLEMIIGLKILENVLSNKIYLIKSLMDFLNIKEFINVKMVLNLK